MRNLPAVAQPTLLPVESQPRAIVPLRDDEPNLRQWYEEQILDGVLPLLCKVAPSLPDVAAERFRVSIAASLSDLPGEVAMEAVRRSLSAQLRLEPKRRGDEPAYRPIQRAGEIETLIRQQADVLRRLAAARHPRPQPARNLREPAIEAPVTQADVDEMNRIMRRFGIEREWRLSTDSRLEPILTDAELRQRAKRRSPLP